VRRDFCGGWVFLIRLEQERSVRLRSSLLVLVLVGTTLAAQQPQPASPAAPAAAGAGRGAGGRGQGAAPIRSPEIAPDGRVTLRLRAPNAREVVVNGLGPRLVMQKDDQGVWSATTEPLTPEIYTYTFSVDGATINDPGNPHVKTAYVGGGQSLLRVPGNRLLDPPSGPRGTIAHHYFRSDIVGDDRDFYVYTPPNYDPRRAEPYPVLYLLHGLGDDAFGWLSVGAANVILDNLINSGRAKPMVMVNSLGYGTAGMLVSGRGNLGGDQMIPNFTASVLKEVMPQVERMYRVSTNRDDRAIAGLSMGGAQALYAGLNNLDQFAWVASFSGAFVMYPRAGGPGPTAAPAGGGRGGAALGAATFERAFPRLDARANDQLRLLWITCGTADGLITVNRELKDWLKTKNVRFTESEIPNVGHVWPLWRENLADLAPRLFR
jgi:enterochelin esterase family protein